VREKSFYSLSVLFFEI